MRVRLSSFRLHSIFVATVIMGLSLGLSYSFGEDASPAGIEKSARERELRDQLQKILDELDELQQPPEKGSAVLSPPTVVQESIEPTTAEPVPHYELADVSIVSERVQRRPEGLSLAATEPSETDSQPTRTMKESMESLPGVVLRQANGPRDFSMMIRGQGAKNDLCRA